jgi:hypothetical protein
MLNASVCNDSDHFSAKGHHNSAKDHHNSEGGHHNSEEGHQNSETMGNIYDIHFMGMETNLSFKI